jgi:hypothetical protein
MSFYGLISLLIILHTTVIEAKILIFTYAYNRPDFVEIQHKTFQKFMKNEYEFVVFNDATDAVIHAGIHQVCAQYQIECVDIPQEIHSRPYLHREPQEGYHDPAVRNANVVQYSLHTRGFAHDDILMLIDSDMFAVKPFNVRAYMDGYDIAGLQCHNKGISYLWIGLVILNMKTMPNKNSINFNCGKVNGVGVDAGGYSYHYIQNNPSARIAYFDNFYINCYGSNTITNNMRGMLDVPYDTSLLQRLGFDAVSRELIRSGAHRIEFLLDNTFFHYRSGTNWNQQSGKYHEQKTKLFARFIQKKLQSGGEK